MQSIKRGLLSICCMQFLRQLFNQVFSKSIQPVSNLMLEVFPVSLVQESSSFPSWQREVRDPPIMLVLYSVEQFGIKSALIEHKMELFWGGSARNICRIHTCLWGSIKECTVWYWYLCKHRAACPTISLSPTKDIIYRRFVSPSGRVRESMIEGPH